MADISLATLPPTMRRLIGAMGVQQTIVLLTARGGTRFYLGGRRGRRDRRVLADIVGVDAAAAFYREFERAGTEVTLPKADKILVQIRDAEIRKDETRSLTELALAYHLTTRHIQNIRSRESAAAALVETAQFDLFIQPTSRNADETALSRN